MIDRSFAEFPPVTSNDSLTVAVAAAVPGSVIAIAAGTYRLDKPLIVPTGVALVGAGVGKTILTHAPEWQAATATLPDPETDFRKFDDSGYLIHLAAKASNISLSRMTLVGPGLHGAIYGWENRKVLLSELRFEDFMYA